MARYAKRRAVTSDESPVHRKSMKVEGVAGECAKAAPVKVSGDLESGIDCKGNKYWELSGKRRVSVSEWKGNMMVNIREYYEKNGETLPGAKGITLPIEQYQALLNVIGEVNATLREKDVDIKDPKLSPSETSKPQSNAAETGEKFSRKDTHDDEDDDVSVDEDKDERDDK